MQALALTVVEVDTGDGAAAAKISALRDQLIQEGYACSVVSVSATDPAPSPTTDPAPSPTIDAAAGGEGGSDPAAPDGSPDSAAPATEPAVASDTAEVAAGDVAASEGPDNSLPFKCPACGSTYESEVACSNGHAPVLTLPTAEVLAGAAPEPSAETPAPEPAAPDASSAAGAPAEPAAEGGAGPGWPA